MPAPPRLHAPRCICDVVARHDGCASAACRVVMAGAERGSGCTGLTGSRAALLLVVLCEGVASLLEPRGRRPSAGHSSAAGASGRVGLISALSTTARVAAPSLLEF